MKNIILTTFIVLVVLMVSCFKLDETPVLTYDGEANATIAQIQALHTLGAGPATYISDSLCMATVGEKEMVITGIVTSTDKYGSAYKEMFLQDETGGISIRIANTSYSTKYRIGQRIFVKMNGLYIGNYVSGGGVNGFYQIGLSYPNGGMEYIPEKVENTNIFRDNIPDPSKIDVKTISSEKDIIPGIGGDYHKRVTLTNCYFADANGTTTYFPSGSTGTYSRNINFNEGTGTVQARISQYCTFANEILPEGTVNVTGLLTLFGTSPQLIICSLEDVVAPQIILSYDMNVNPLTQGWTVKQVEGDATWTYTNKQMLLDVPKETSNESWLISPKLNLAGAEDVTFAFSYRINNGTKEQVQALYTTDGTNWINFDFTPNVGSWMEANLKLDPKVASDPNLQVAFKCKTNNSMNNQLMWAIRSITFKGNLIVFNEL